MWSPPSLSPCDCATWGKYEGNPHMPYEVHEERELVECGAHPLSPHVIVPHGANMRGTLICHMRCIFLYIYIMLYLYFIYGILLGFENQILMEFGVGCYNQFDLISLKSLLVEILEKIF